MYFVSGIDVLPAKKAGVDGPCTGPDHGGGSAKSCDDNRHPRITGLGKSDPQFDAGDQCSYHWSPEADEKKYPGAGANAMRKHRCKSGCICGLDSPEANENDGGQNALQQEPHAWPTVGEG